jgi:hypothetical protein
MSTLSRRLARSGATPSRGCCCPTAHCPGAHEVIFNRLYNPVVERVAGGPPMACEPHDWIRPVENIVWLFDDATAPWVSSADDARLEAG